MEGEKEEIIIIGEQKETPIIDNSNNNNSNNNENNNNNDNENTTTTTTENKPNNRRRKAGESSTTQPKRTLASLKGDTNAFSRSIAAATPASHIISSGKFFEAEKEKKEKKKSELKLLASSNDPIPERVETNVPPIPSERLKKLSLLGANESYCGENKLEEWKVLQEHLYKEGRIDTQGALHLIHSATEILKLQPNLLELQAPITICGDIHGQFYDLCNLFSKLGEISSSKYLFLGDYVDRGDFSCEVCFFLLGLLVTYPSNIYLLRGNHESRLITTNFNFRRECYAKYGTEVYDALMVCFDWMPISAIIHTSDSEITYFACHGGLSPDLKYIDEINAVNRAVETPGVGILCDLLWSDPIPDDEAEDLDDEDLDDWRMIEYRVNKTRGCSYEFGYEAVRKFLKRNHLTAILRAHEVKRDGFEEHFFYTDDSNEIPPVITIFSAPNYCDMYENKAGFMSIFSNGQYQFGQIDWVSHPYWLPDFENAFTFSVPYLVECVTQLYVDFLGMLGIDESQAQDLSNIYHSYTRQRMRREKLLMLKKNLLEGKADKFIEALKFDKSNELRPKVKKGPPILMRSATAKW